MQCSAKINGATITAQAVFNVARPMARIISQTGSVGIGYADDGFTYGLYFGANGDNPPGILFSNVVTMPSGNYNHGNPNYQLNWVQIIVPIYTGTETLDGTNVYVLSLVATNVVLDTLYPYGFSPNFPYPDAEDGPGVQITTTEIAASFSQKSEMWLMFQPTNGQWVPLRTVSWNCAGVATNSGSGWTKTSASWSTNPPDADAGTAYPTWTNIISHIPLQTNYIGNP